MLFVQRNILRLVFPSSTGRQRTISTRTRRINCAATPKKWARFCQLYILPINQPHVSLIDQCRCLQEMPRGVPASCSVEPIYGVLRGRVEPIAPTQPDHRHSKLGAMK